MALIPPQRPGENDISSLAILLWSACRLKYDGQRITENQGIEASIGILK
jgi:hypothetical protein